MDQNRNQAQQQDKRNKNQQQGNNQEQQQRRQWDGNDRRTGTERRHGAGDGGIGEGGIGMQMNEGSSR